MTNVGLLSFLMPAKRSLARDPSRVAYRSGSTAGCLYSSFQQAYCSVRLELHKFTSRLKIEGEGCERNQTNLSVFRYLLLHLVHPYQMVIHLQILLHRDVEAFKTNIISRVYSSGPGQTVKCDFWGIRN